MYVADEGSFPCLVGIRDFRNAAASLQVAVELQAGAFPPPCPVCMQSTPCPTAHTAIIDNPRAGS